jgi:hypothetical protein
MVDPPAADIDITAARLTPNCARLWEVHPERPILVLGQQRVTDKSALDFRASQLAWQSINGLGGI